MASRTYRDQVIVLKKTKLKESDLIVTLLAADGRQIRAVAKGARKPTSSFAARLELFSNAQVSCAQGRSLDIVKEARLVDAHAALRSDVGLAACASPMAELLSRSTQDALPVPRLFAMTQEGLHQLEGAQGTARLLVCAAFLLKACAVLGFRPCLDCCVECGSSLGVAAGAAGQAPEGPVAFSARAGGALCAHCPAPADAVRVDARVVAWASTLLGARFAQIAGFEADEATARAVLGLARQWTAEHIGRLKSLDMLLAMGVY